ncbi:MAG: 3'-5' exonuclease, partial [Spirochaetota bacterium]|nr:3'-5' exonuclease [Spirochaetota bacterium]
KNDLAGTNIPGASELEQDKLFFVGDEKQSIYRFRGADVSVFKGLSKELTSSGGKALVLGTNYRSEPDLINFFNKVFGLVMKDAEAPFEAEFESLGSRDSVVGVTPEISIFYKPESKVKGDFLHNNEAEAWYIAKFIKDKVETKSMIILKNGSLVSAGYDDFLILMRSTSNQIMYEKYFRKLNIPCTVQGVRALFMEAPVNDIYNLLQLLIYPGDLVSYAALLRSPFVNLSDDITAAILLDKNDAFSLSDIRELEGVSPGEEDIIKYNNAMDLYISLTAKVDFIPVADLIRVIWYEGGYRNYLMSNKEYHGYLEYYDYLKTLAVRSDERGDCLAVFLDFIRDNLGKYEKLPDLELLRDETAGVQLMTIHKSKGLEFPVVIVANTGNTGRPGGVSPYYISDDFGITLKYESRSGGKANYFYDHAKDLEDQKDLAENKRILYVAMTRAQSHLIISGGHNSKSKNSESATGQKVLLNMVLKGIGWDGEPGSLSSEVFKKYIKIIPDVTGREINSVKGPSSDIDLDKIRSDYKNCETIERISKRDTWSVSEINLLYTGTIDPGFINSEKLTSLESDRFLTEEHFAAFGTYCHKIIESNLKGFTDNVVLSPSFSTFQESQKKFLEKDAQKLASNFLTSIFAMKLKKGSFESELSFLLNIGNSEKPVFINGQIDLLIEKNDEVVIVDFKTDKYQNPEEYAVQMFLYRQAAREIYNKPVLSYLFYLRDGRAVKVDSIFRLSK